MMAESPAASEAAAPARGFVFASAAEAVVAAGTAAGAVRVAVAAAGTPDPAGAEP
jgi:hypothetical protein